MEPMNINNVANQTPSMDKHEALPSIGRLIATESRRRRNVSSRSRNKVLNVTLTHGVLQMGQKFGLLVSVLARRLDRKVAKIASRSGHRALSVVSIAEEL
jgi:hypothetical protein